MPDPESALRRLSETETLLWNLEQNPNLSTTMGAVALLDGPPDPDRLRATVTHALSAVAPLRERVFEQPLSVSRPYWAVDRNFDLDAHLRFARLPVPASRRSLLEFATRFINDPFDRTRPLWSWTVITGLPRGRAALISKLHHSIADGQGALKLVEHLLEFSPDAPAPVPADPVDVLRPFVDIADTGPPPLFPGGIRSGAERLKDVLGAAAESLADPARRSAAGQDVVALAQSLGTPLAEPSASRLWSERSRNRRARVLSVGVESLQAAARRHSTSLDTKVSINDIFVAACSRGVVRYHQHHGDQLAHVAATVVVSVRGSNDPDAHNAAVPTALTIPGHGVDPDDQVAAIGRQVQKRRGQLSGSRMLLGPLTGLAGLLPGSMSANAALGQSAKIDISTSNLPGPPVPLWLAGREILELIPLGPVVGTACNLTLLSYKGTATVGLHLDPVAIPDIDVFLTCVALGFSDLGLPRPTTR